LSALKTLGDFSNLCFLLFVIVINLLLILCNLQNYIDYPILNKKSSLFPTKIIPYLNLMALQTQKLLTKKFKFFNISNQFKKIIHFLKFSNNFNTAACLSLTFKNSISGLLYLDLLGYPVYNQFPKLFGLPLFELTVFMLSFIVFSPNLSIISGSCSRVFF